MNNKSSDEYKEYNDYELLDYVAEDVEEATEVLYNKYKVVIDCIIRKYSFPYHEYGIEYNDLVQEGMVGLSEAIKGYKNYQEATFYTFACICIERQIKEYLTKIKRKKHQVLNQSLSFDSCIGNTEKTIGEVISNFDYNPEKIVVDNDKEKVIYDKAIKAMTDVEYKIFLLKANGVSNREIAEQYHYDARKVTNILQRVKMKLKKIIDNC